MTVDRDALQSKLRRLEHEMHELKSSGTGDAEILQLRTAKHDLERKLAESEDDIGDLQQELHDLNMVLTLLTYLLNLCNWILCVITSIEIGNEKWGRQLQIYKSCSCPFVTIYRKNWSCFIDV